MTTFKNPTQKRRLSNLFTDAVGGGDVFFQAIPYTVKRDKIMEGSCLAKGRSLFSREY
jgi:hypothetical protein